jgi:hypothetical protein
MGNPRLDGLIGTLKTFVECEHEKDAETDEHHERQKHPDHTRPAAARH